MPDSDRPERESTVRYLAVAPRQRMPSLTEMEPFEPDTEVGRRSLPAQVPSRRDRAVLTILTGVNAGQVLRLPDGEASLGRGRDATFRIEDVGISRKHARIVHTESGAFVVEDLGSTNGVFVDGTRITRHEVKSGDRIQIGPNVVLRFALVDPTEENLARQLYEASTRDPLTQAFNRKAFTERLAAEVAYATRHRAHLGVLILDLDHFKNVNDTHGHAAGDVVLRVVAAQIARTIRLEDVFARYGGEEFVILTRGIGVDKLARFGDRLRVAVERLQIPWEGHDLRATVSVGVAMLAESGTEGAAAAELGERMVSLADQRLYRAKEQGRNRVVSA
jgi:diguanylate cyclase (GGDEF)-like protein